MTGSQSPIDGHLCGRNVQKKKHSPALNYQFSRFRLKQQDLARSQIAGRFGLVFALYPFGVNKGSQESFGLCKQFEAWYERKHS